MYNANKLIRIAIAKFLIYMCIFVLPFGGYVINTYWDKTLSDLFHSPVFWVLWVLYCISNFIFYRWIKKDGWI